MITLSALAWGVPVALHVEADEVAQVRALLPFWWADAAAPPTDGSHIPPHEWTLSADNALTGIRAMELRIAECARGVVFVHSGVIARNGRALLLPGRSLVGKTTLVAALLRAGADYLSDEYAVLHPDGTVSAYPRPLSMRGSTPERTAVPASELGARSVDGPLPVAAVAQVSFALDARWEPEPLGTGDAVLALLDNTVSAQRAPAEALETVATVVDGATHLMRARRGDADSVVGDVLALLDD